jgi:peptidoglycan/xylan/chitin deacetylase (PgdA/CDA1 family)
VQVSAADNVGVAGVSLLIDGATLGAQDTTSPYTFLWDSTLVTNGVHTISARVTDTSNNTANATLVSITIANSTTTPPTGNNLVLNSALETSGTAGNPANWNRGGWGTNDRTFTYPVAGTTSNAARVAITSYTSGDAKWYFDDVVVTPGEQYTFSYSYKSSVTTNITLRYTRADGTFLYVGTGNIGANSNWINGSFTVIPPTGAVALTVMHILNQVGSLEIDNQSLYSGNNNTFSRGKVSFSFDDGWLEHSTIAAPVLNDAGLDGTFYIINDQMLGVVSSERLQNPTLDIVGTAGNPANWNRGGWGTNDRTFTYPAAGATSNAARVAITSYTSGDAKWYFDDVAVLQNTNYSISGSYQANASSQLMVRYLLQSGAYLYQPLGNLSATGLGNWTTYNESFVTPADAVSITVFHLLSQVGELTTDNMSVVQTSLYANTADVLAIQAAGHEIGAHTKTHTSLTTLNTAGKMDEISGSKADLEAVGLNIETIAYPYGDYDGEVKAIVAAEGFSLGRSVDRGFNDMLVDSYALKIQQVGRNTPLAQLQSWIDQAEQNNTWLILMFHQINDDPTATLGINESDFVSLVSYADSADVDVITVAEGSALLNN